MRNKKIQGIFARGRKWVFTLALFILVFAAASIVKVQAATTIMGWLWGGSEDANLGGVEDCITYPGFAESSCIDGDETGVGWISMNNTNEEIPDAQRQTDRPYNVTIDEAGKVSGYAWANAGGNLDNGDQNGLGWIKFDAEPDYAKYTNGYPGTPYHGVQREDDSLTGWARFVEIKNEYEAGNSGGWEGWLKMYNVTIDPVTNKISGYAWNGETDLSNTDGNMAEGLGWISFGRATIESIGELEFAKDDVVLGGIWTYENNENDRSLANIRVKGSDGNTCENVTISSSNDSVLKIINEDIGDIVNPNEVPLEITTYGVDENTSVQLKATSTNCVEEEITAVVQNVVLANCSPSEQTVIPGSTATIQTSPLTPGASWTIVSGSEYIVGGSGTPLSGGSSYSVEVKPDVTFKTIEVSADGGDHICKLSVSRRGWIETNP